MPPHRLLAYVRHDEWCERIPPSPRRSPASVPLRSTPARVPGRLQKRSGAFRLRVPERSSSYRHLQALVSCTVIAVDHAKFLADSKQCFCVPDEEISIRIEAAMEFFDQP